jgi:Putative DNA-binding domain
MSFEHLLLAGESQTLEFKTSFDKATVESLVAFANTQGGTVLVGVNDAGVILGVTLGKETLNEWLGQIKSATPAHHSSQIWRLKTWMEKPWWSFAWVSFLSNQSAPVADILSAWPAPIISSPWAKLPISTYNRYNSHGMHIKPAHTPSTHYPCPRLNALLAK